MIHPVSYMNFFITLAPEQDLTSYENVYRYNLRKAVFENKLGRRLYMFSTNYHNGNEMPFCLLKNILFKVNNLSLRTFRILSCFF